MRVFRQLNFCIFVFGLISCSSQLPSELDIIPKNDWNGDSINEVFYTEQNWSREESLEFYYLSQGSNLMPYTLFTSLQLHGSNEKFSSNKNMSKYRYILQNKSKLNPDGLPIGWTKNTYQDKDYIGLTCAACHTAQINFKGKGIRIDGGPAMADFDHLLVNLEKSLFKPLANKEKFDQLFHNISKKDKNIYPTPKKLREELEKYSKIIKNYNYINNPINGNKRISYGYSRLDAFGRIYNRILSHLTPNDSSNFNPANAPVSYPFLWDTPQHDFVQWNGVGDNGGTLKLGPLGRNTGEVLGVFATFDLSKESGAGYAASANQYNLIKLEESITKLWSPKWTHLAEKNVLPKINKNYAAKGKDVYQEYQCQSCHSDINRMDPNRKVIAQMSSVDSIGTDKQMASNALSYYGKSGYFEGDDGFGKNSSVLASLSKATMGVILDPDHDKSLLLRSLRLMTDIFAVEKSNPIGKTRRHVDFEVPLSKQNDASNLYAYKARPLNGIWATAPYLHNGSVPTLQDLFLPSCKSIKIKKTSCRPNKFTVGSREFDPIKVGFVQKKISKYNTLFIFDTGLKGNSNQGHEYAAGITPVFKLKNGSPVYKNGKKIKYKLKPISKEKIQYLVEYLKTL